MFYKIVNNLVGIPADHYLTPSKTRTRTTHSKKMLQYHTRTDTLKFSLFPRTIPTWNMLPAIVAEALDLVSFKRGVGFSSVLNLTGPKLLVSSNEDYLELCRFGVCPGATTVAGLV
jgi:hypothetical protein